MCFFCPLLIFGPQSRKEKVWKWEASACWPMVLAHRNRSDFCDFCDCDAHPRPQKSQRFPRQEKAMLHCDLRVRWKVASDLRFRAAISEPEVPSFWGISGDLAPSTWESLAIAIVRFRCAKSVLFSGHFFRYPLCGYPLWTLPKLSETGRPSCRGPSPTR